MRFWVQIPLVVKIQRMTYGASLQRAFHYHPFIIHHLTCEVAGSTPAEVGNIQIPWLSNGKTDRALTWWEVLGFGEFGIAKIILFQYPRWQPWSLFWNSNHIASQTVIESDWAETWWEASGRFRIAKSFSSSILKLFKQHQILDC